MRRGGPAIVGLLVLLLAVVGRLLPSGAPGPVEDGTDALRSAYEAKAHELQVRGEGRVVRVLADDRDGSRHQRFVLRTGDGLTVLVAHNIDLAPRIPRLAQGDHVRFHGAYVWNDQGGVIHWTHHDPAGRHAGGWLEHEGVRYE
ncbi:MAG: DUF3465 domain-containing protein [Alphaproteobacteria bacterium]|nr:DUF3465 domain-containing protein [Alphaproteobacteria bacterium]